MNKMQELYIKEIAPALLKLFGFKNVMQVPRLEKIVLNIGLGESMDNPKALGAAEGAQKHRELQTARRARDRNKSNPARTAYVGIL